jgi:RNA polymerase sigma factor (sigma-70 family)
MGQKHGSHGLRFMPESIEQILEALAPLLRSELNILGHSAQSTERDDLLQEIRLRIWKALRDKNGEIEFMGAYVKKVVFSVFINEVNRIRQEQKLISVAGHKYRLENAGEADCPGSDNDMRQMVIESLAELGKTKQRVIRLRLLGFTFAEIALISHWPLRKVCSLYYRGIGELKNRLNARGIQYED